MRYGRSCVISGGGARKDGNVFMLQRSSNFHRPDCRHSPTYPPRHQDVNEEACSPHSFASRCRNFLNLLKLNTVCHRLSESGSYKVVTDISSPLVTTSKNGRLVLSEAPDHQEPTSVTSADENIVQESCAIRQTGCRMTCAKVVSSFETIPYADSLSRMYKRNDCAINDSSDYGLDIRDMHVRNTVSHQDSPRRKYHCRRQPESIATTRKSEEPRYLTSCPSQGQDSMQHPVMAGDISSVLPALVRGEEGPDTQVPGSPHDTIGRTHTGLRPQMCHVLGGEAGAGCVATNFSHPSSSAVDNNNVLPQNIGQQVHEPVRQRCKDKTLINSKQCWFSQDRPLLEKPQLPCLYNSRDDRPQGTERGRDVHRYTQRGGGASQFLPRQLGKASKPGPTQVLGDIVVPTALKVATQERLPRSTAPRKYSPGVDLPGQTQRRLVLYHQSHSPAGSSGISTGKTSEHSSSFEPNQHQVNKTLCNETCGDIARYDSPQKRHNANGVFDMSLESDDSLLESVLGHNYGVSASVIECLEAELLNQLRYDQECNGGSRCEWTYDDKGRQRCHKVSHSYRTRGVNRSDVTDDNVLSHSNRLLEEFRAYKAKKDQAGHSLGDDAGMVYHVQESHML